MAYRGKYKPKFPKKYRGDPTSIIYRSLWERNCMVYFDKNPSILEWASEEVIVPYKSPIDSRWHRYFPDFIIHVEDKEKKRETIMIEVKPYAQTKEPKIKSKSSKPTKKYLYEVSTYSINIAKWKAAKEFCADKNWKFMLLTEKELPKWR
jgi:hypothetical protein